MPQTTVTARAWIDRQDPTSQCWAVRLTSTADTLWQEDDALELPLGATEAQVVAEVERHVSARGFALIGNVEVL